MTTVPEAQKILAEVSRKKFEKYIVTVSYLFVSNLGISTVSSKLQQSINYE